VAAGRHARQVAGGAVAGAPGHGRAPAVGLVLHAAAHAGIGRVAGVPTAGNDPGPAVVVVLVAHHQVVGAALVVELPRAACGQAVRLVLDRELEGEGAALRAPGAL